MFEKFFRWSFSIGKSIIKAKCGEEKGKDLLRRLIFDIRGEDTPGRFLERLSKRLVEYRTNTNIQANVEILPEIMEKEEWHADKFFYLKASILAGLLNALAGGGEKGE
jgi:hypothetical protein